LCSIERLGAALAEIRRALDPSGAFLFLEHGRSDRRWVASVQDVFNPIQNVIGCGCNLNREIDHEIETSGFRIDEIERFTVPGVPRAVGSVFLGVARHPERPFDDA
ncbi:MAG: SAM-dependent methyltransferase, partial [Gemmatimonadetes bacterium]|nr:SAM-dependent methyltransferase [Gemmatimonadota bacterium]